MDSEECYEVISPRGLSQDFPKRFLDFRERYYHCYLKLKEKVDLEQGKDSKLSADLENKIHLLKVFYVVLFQSREGRLLFNALKNKLENSKKDYSKDFKKIDKQITSLLPFENLKKKENLYIEALEGVIKNEAKYSSLIDDIKSLKARRLLIFQEYSKVENYDLQIMNIINSLYYAYKWSYSSKNNTRGEENRVKSEFLENIKKIKSNIKQSQLLQGHVDESIAEYER